MDDVREARLELRANLRDDTTGSSTSASRHLSSRSGTAPPRHREAIHTCILTYKNVRTTIALDASLRDRLLALKRSWKVASVEAVLQRLLEGSPQTATGLYAEHKSAVDKALAKHHVRKLIAFGSRARGDARPDSDLDLAVVLPRGADLMDLAVLREELAEAFGLRVDVVSLASARPRLRARIDAEWIEIVG